MSKYLFRFAIFSHTIKKVKTGKKKDHVAFVKIVTRLDLFCFVFALNWFVSLIKRNRIRRACNLQEICILYCDTRVANVDSHLKERKRSRYYSSLPNPHCQYAIFLFVPRILIVSFPFHLSFPI